MQLSTKGRYGVRMVLELALQPEGSATSLSEIARVQGLSEKYLWSLVNPLKAAGIIGADRGAHGGYSLLRDPATVTVRELLDVLEGGIRLAACERQQQPCDRMGQCVMRDVWMELEGGINRVLESVTLGDLAARYRNRRGTVADTAMFYI